MSAPYRLARARVAAACVAALMLTTAVLGGSASQDRGGGVTGTEPAGTGAASPKLAWTDAMWTDTKGAAGDFTALQLGNVQNVVCTTGVLASATVTWQRPTGTPSGVLSYRVTVQRSGTNQTTTQTATTFTYNRPVGNFNNVTLIVQPVIGQWSGPSRSIFLDASQVLGMRCP